MDGPGKVGNLPQPRRAGDTTANRVKSHKGATHRKRSGEGQPSSSGDRGRGAGIPESVVIGL
jgi:ZIP family zinc transporter